MGKIVSRLIRREVTRFNVESRAQRILNQTKPVAAPKYKSNIKDMERALQADPYLLVKLNKKNTELDDRLKQVFVTSRIRSNEEKDLRNNNIKHKRPLPLDRTTPDEFEFGYMESKRVPVGRCTLRQALLFITANQSEPDTWTKERIAKDNKMKEHLIGNILHYFKSFSVYIPHEKLNYKELIQTKTKQLKPLEEQK